MGAQPDWNAAVERLCDSGGRLRILSGKPGGAGLVADAQDRDRAVPGKGRLAADFDRLFVEVHEDKS